MRILIDLTSLADNFSGIERYALNISKQMLKNDKKNEYIIIFKNNIHKEFLEFNHKNNIELLVIKGKGKLLFGQFKLLRYLYKQNADKYLFLAFPSPILFRKKGIVNTIHDLTAWDYPSTMEMKSRMFFKVSIKNAIKKSDKIVTVSQFSKTRIQEKFKYDKIRVIYNGVSEVFEEAIDCDKHKKKKILEKYNLSEKYLMCLCTLEPRKNIKLLLDAYLELKIDGKIDNSYKLVLVGRRGWKVDDLLLGIDKRFLEDIIITGFVEDYDLPYLYRGAECFVFPSLYEGFGIPVLEAMHMKTPIILSNSSSLPEVAGEAGIYFNNNDKEDLKNKIIYFLNLKEKDKNDIAQKGYERSKLFKWKIEGEKLIDYIVL